VALLPAMTHETALAFSDSLRAAILADLQRPDGSPLTVSIGVATAFEDGQLFRALLSEADARLYAAKNNGRDQVHGRYGMWVG
jgi:diguanylate cyclase (GGDEF)-like protein